MSTKPIDEDRAASLSGVDAEEFVEDPRMRRIRLLVSLLLIVMIAGFLTIVIALLLKLKDLPSIGVAPLAPGETIASATSTADRISLTLINAETGRERVVILDAASFKPIAVVKDGALGETQDE